MYKSLVSPRLTFPNHRIFGVHENVSSCLLFSSTLKRGSLKLNLIKVSRSLEIMNMLFDFHRKYYLPAWFVLLRSRVHFRVCAGIRVLPQEPLFRKGFGKGGLWSAKQWQEHLSMAGVRTSTALWTPRNHFPSSLLWAQISDAAISRVEWNDRVFVLWVWTLPEMTYCCTPRINGCDDDGNRMNKKNK